MRASTVPLLENEPLVVIRASFLALCDGDHCTAALLNDFVYWHDWCIAHGRYDATASQADPGHRAVDPECWFWKTTAGIVNDDLLRLWGEKKVRVAIELLESKGYAASRFNPKDPCDRTKQYRLIPDRLAADLEAWSAAQDSAGRAAEMPNASGKNAACTPSTTYDRVPMRQKCRMHPAKMPDVPTETTHSETTRPEHPSSSVHTRAEGHARRMSEDGTGPAAEHRISLEQEAQAEAGMSATARLIVEWAGERHIRRRRDDRSYGHPDAYWAEQWGVYCQERGIGQRDAVFQVMDAAKATADRRDQWRYWKYLDEQVQQAAERYVAPYGHPSATPESELTCPVEDPNTEWGEVKRILAARVNPIGYANWVERTCQLGRDSAGLRVWVPDEVTQDWLEHEYAGYISEALATIGGLRVHYTRQHDSRNQEALCPSDEEPGTTSGEVAGANPERAIVTCRNEIADYVAPGPK